MVVIDKFPVEANIQRYWDCPRKWHTWVGLPEPSKIRNGLTDALARDTLEHTSRIR